MLAVTEGQGMRLRFYDFLWYMKIILTCYHRNKRIYHRKKRIWH